MLKSNKSSFKIILKYLEKFGMTLPTKASRLLHVRGVIFHVLCVTPCPLLSLLHLLLVKNLDMDKFNYNAAFYAQSFCFIFKVMPFIINGNRIRKCVENLENHQFPLMRKQHENILNKSYQICQRNTTIFLIFCSGGVGSWAIKPFFEEERVFPAEIWLPFDARTNFLTFYAIYFYITIGIILNTFVTGLIDPLMAGLAFHATNHIKILKDYLKNLDLYVNEETFHSLTKKNNEIYWRITQLVEHYNFVTSFVKEFEACFSWVFFSQMSASIFALCFTCLQILQVKTFDYYSLQLGLYILVMLGQINFYCYYGSKLTEASNEITTSVYMCNWYNYDLKCKKALITLMQQSQVPLIVTAGKFVDLSLLTLATIIRRSYSLVAVFKNN